MKRALLLSLLLLPSIALAQAPSDAPAQQKKLIPRSSEDVEKVRKAERHISLDVLAMDSHDKAVSGLTQQDFSVLVDDHPQPVASFRAEPSSDPPTEVMLVIDLINTTALRVSYERQQIEKFLRQNQGNLQYPVRLVILTETQTQVIPQATRDGNALANLLESANSPLRAVGRSAGIYGAEEHLQESLQAFRDILAFQQQRPGRKLMIWLSPGWPLLSSPGIDFNDKTRRYFFGMIVQFNEAMRIARTVVEALDPLGPGDSDLSHYSYYKEFLKGVARYQDATSANLALQVTATHSGGRVFTPGNDLVSELNTCMIDAGPYYVLSFDAAPSERADQYHSIAVRIARPGVTTRTNTAFYGQP